MTIVKLFVLACVLYIGYELSKYFYRRGRLVVRETENIPTYPVLSRVRGTVKRPFFLHYIHMGHRDRRYSKNRAMRRRWFQEAV